MTDKNLDRRTYLATLGAASVAGLAGCRGGYVAAQTGTLATAVTDQPGDIADFESCVVTIVGVWLGPDETDSEDGSGDGAGNDTEAPEGEGTEDEETEDGGREYLEFDEPQEADLVQLQGDNTQLVDERELETGTHSYLQLDTDGVDATLANGDSATVEVPGNAPLKFNESFEIRADTRTEFTADFTPVKRGNSGSYNLQPVASGVTVEYEEIEQEDNGNETESDNDGTDSSDE